MLNFRIGFLLSIGGRLPYPCLPTPCPILRLSESDSQAYRTFLGWTGMPVAQNVLDSQDPRGGRDSPR